MFPDQNRGEFGVQVSHWSRPSSCGERARVSLINSVWRLQWLDRESCRLNVLHSVKPLSRGLWRTCRVISQSFIAASAAYICTFTTWMLLLLLLLNAAKDATRCPIPLEHLQFLPHIRCFHLTGKQTGQSVVGNHNVFFFFFLFTAGTKTLAAMLVEALLGPCRMGWVGSGLNTT